MFYIDGILFGVLYFFSYRKICIMVIFVLLGFNLFIILFSVWVGMWEIIFYYYKFGKYVSEM